MKIAVYTIALNEEKFVQSWYDSAKEADYLLIADTGSTDGTAEKARSLGIDVITISIKPWRFDDARNASLASIPADVDLCIALDMDEVLMPGWRSHLEKVAPTTTRPRYTYTWSWKDEEKQIPGLQYGGDKIHARHGYRWKHPVHEVIIADRIDEKQEWTSLEIQHHPDNTKPRSQYLSLLELSVKEDPQNDRNAFYYARELNYYGKTAEAIKEFKRHLSLPTAVWPAERAASMRFLSKLEGANMVKWLMKAIKEDPGRREPLVELSLYYFAQANWKYCHKFARQAVSITEKPMDYLCEEFAWGYLPWDLAAVSAYYLGLKQDAKEFGEIALSHEPNDERLARNLVLYATQ